MADLLLLRAGRVDYHEAWARQRELHAARVADERPDTVLLLEHDPVYTAGRRTHPDDRPRTDPGAPVVDVDRGGRITWHGPGQLTGYPIVAVPPLAATTSRREGLVDVVAHVRRLEEAIIRVCAEFDVAAQRVEGRSGVWAGRPETPGRPNAKVAAIGVRVSRGVAMHGFALNADCDLSWFDRIVPCGLRDASVTSLSELTGRRVGVADVLEPVERHLRTVLATTVPTPV